MIIKDILSKIPCVSFVGNEQEKLTEILSLDDHIVSNNTLSWCNDKNWKKIITKDNGTFIVSQFTFDQLTNSSKSSNANYIIAENPRQYFSKCLLLFQEGDLEFGVSTTAVVHATAIIGSEGIYIGNNVVIEKNVEISNGVRIDHNTVIKKDTIIGSNSKIGSNCTIGGVGFGYEKDENGNYQVIPHIGKVVIGANVEIGNNVCIDRAVLGSTTLNNNVKVDNLVHIAHGVSIGENSLIIANAMIAGSVSIGENVWVAPSASIMQKKVIGNDVTIGMGSVVLKDVEDQSVVAGVPAKNISKK